LKQAKKLFGFAYEWKSLNKLFGALKLFEDPNSFERYVWKLCASDGVVPPVEAGAPPPPKYLRKVVSLTTW